MPRWEPGSTERMQQAALELFAEQGFENTTADEIAARAGVTKRTFFRHFPDKREVLFHGPASGFPVAAVIEGIARADATMRPLRMIASAVAGYDWDGLAPRLLQRKRHAVIAANPELLERQLIKYEAIRLEFAEVLRQRGFDDDAARLAADIGIALCRSAYELWLRASDDTGMDRIIDDVVDTLRISVSPESFGSVRGRPGS
ncbi:TetR family transcriptional regulator [Amycolatopsis sp. NPDC003865]